MRCSNHRQRAWAGSAPPEIAEYPESGKFGVLAEFPPGADGKPRGLRFVGRAEAALDYREGE